MPRPVDLAGTSTGRRRSGAPPGTRVPVDRAAHGRRTAAWLAGSPWRCQSPPTAGRTSTTHRRCATTIQRTHRRVGGCLASRRLASSAPRSRLGRQSSVAAAAAAGPVAVGRRPRSRGCTSLARDGPKRRSTWAMLRCMAVRCLRPTLASSGTIWAQAVRTDPVSPSCSTVRGSGR